MNLLIFNILSALLNVGVTYLGRRLGILINVNIGLFNRNSSLPISQDIIYTQSHVSVQKNIVTLFISNKSFYC